MKLLTLSPGIASRADIEVFLGGSLVRRSTDRHVDAVVTWGRKIGRDSAEEKARLWGKPLWRLEDGLIAYASHPRLDRRSLSLIADRSGIYYDATRSSDFEDLCQAVGVVDEERIQKVLATLRTEALSKYNHIRPQPLWSLPATEKKRILLVDQTFGDRSVHYGQGSEEAFTRMVQSALQDHPDAEIFARVHPDTSLGPKRGYLRERLDARIQLLDGAINIVQLLEAMDEVYVVTSQVGFEALLLGKKVHCFGLPFYAGWGLTQDTQSCSRRQRALSLAQLATVALLQYPRYVQPETAQRCELEDILSYLSQTRLDRLDTSLHYQALGFSLWKRGLLRHFLAGRAASLRFLNKPQSIRLKDPQRDALLVWGTRFSDCQDAWRQAGFKVVRVEDGFIRSVGLGVDLKRPSSLVFDQSGLYYDARHPSDLEKILSCTVFTAKQHQQARDLRAHILRHRISKYNVQDDQAKESEPFPAGSVLVIGQVAGDASLHQGLAMAQSDAEFLRLVRARHPEAVIVYKPHPDVISKNREQAPVSPELYDRMITDLSLHACLQRVESVHVMSSLAGFEALLQGKTVHTYGLPFYAGWGLTVDALTCARRQRRLTLEDLIAGALLLYPSYYNWQRACSGTAQGIVRALADERTQKAARIGSSKAERWWRKIRYFLESRGTI